MMKTGRPLGLNWSASGIRQCLVDTLGTGDPDDPLVARIFGHALRTAVGRFGIVEADPHICAGLGLQRAQLMLSRYYGGTIRAVTLLEAGNGVVFNLAETGREHVFARRVFGDPTLDDLLAREEMPFIPKIDDLGPFPLQDQEMEKIMRSLTMEVRKQFDSLQGWRTGCFIDPEDHERIIPDLVESARSPDLSRKRLYMTQALGRGHVTEHVFDRAASPLEGKGRDDDILRARSARDAILGGSSVMNVLMGYYGVSRPVIRATAGYGRFLTLTGHDDKILSHLDRLAPEHLPKCLDGYTTATRMHNAGMNIRTAGGDWSGAAERLQGLQDFSDVQKSFRDVLRDRCETLFGTGRTHPHLFDILESLIPDSLSGRERMSRRWHAIASRMEADRLSRTDPEGRITWRPLTGPARYGDRIVREAHSMADLVRIGLDQEHCVGTYTADVLHGSALVFTIGNPEAVTSTFELDAGFSMVQHHGPVNQDPPQEDEAIALAFIEDCRPTEEVMQAYRRDLLEISILYEEKVRNGLSQSDREDLFETWLAGCLPDRLDIRTIVDLDNRIFEFGDVSPVPSPF